MLKILLADGEVENARVFIGQLESMKAEIREIRVVNQDPEKISTLAEDYKPNLILADAGFLGGDCSKIVGGLYKTHPEIKWILYASYNENNLIQSSMDFELFDYLYKPVKPSELTRCIQNAVDYFGGIERKKAEERLDVEKYRRDIDKYRELFLWDLLNERLESRDELAKGLEYYSISVGAPYTVFLVRPERMDADEQKRNLTLYRIQKVTDQVLDGKQFSILLERGAVCYILSGCGPQELNELCEKLSDAIFGQAKQKVTIGVGRTYADAAKLPVSYREARSALRYGFYMGKAAVIHMRFAEPLYSVSDCISPDLELELSRQAAIGDFDGCERLLKRLRAGLDSCGDLPDGMIQWLSRSIIASICRRATERGLKPDGFFAEQKLHTIDEMFSYFRAALAQFCEYAVSERDMADRRIAGFARDYLVKRFREPFDLAQIADSAGTAAEYLEKIFEDFEGMDIYQYLTCQRLDEAKRLIQKSSHSDDVIAIKAGFDDVRQFRDAFREREGMSVREYKVSVSAYLNPRL